MASEGILLGRSEMHIGPEYAGELVGWANSFREGRSRHVLLSLAEVGEDGACLSLPEHGRDVGGNDEGFVGSVTIHANEQVGGSGGLSSLVVAQAVQSSAPFGAWPATPGRFGIRRLGGHAEAYGQSTNMMPNSKDGVWALGGAAIIEAALGELDRVKASPALRTKMYYGLAYHGGDRMLVGPSMAPQTLGELERSVAIHALSTKIHELLSGPIAILRNKDCGQYGSWYFNLAAVLDSVRPAVAELRVQRRTLQRGSPLDAEYELAEYIPRDRPGRDRYNALVVGETDPDADVVVESAVTVWDSICRRSPENLGLGDLVSWYRSAKKQLMHSAFVRNRLTRLQDAETELSINS
jgi:hypothetical protein